MNLVVLETSIKFKLKLNLQINLAKDINSNEIPLRMIEGGVEVEIDQLSDRFADHFQQKIENLTL